MKNFTGCLLLLTSGFSQAESIRLTEDNVAFAYETKAEIPTRPEILAGMLSEDYREAEDEFTAREMFEKIEPVIAKRITSAKETKLWRLEITKTLPQYDFDSGSFPTDLNENTYIPFSLGSNSRYAVLFKNHGEFRQVPVPLETAKKLTASLKKSRVSLLLIEGSIEEAIEKKLDYGKWKTIQFKVTKVSYQLKDGTTIGEFESVTSGNFDDKSAAAGKPDPVGEWTTKDREPECGMTLWQSGDARAEFDSKELSIHLEGKWKLIDEGRWANYIIVSGRIEYWGAGQKDITPKDGKFEFLFDTADSKLTYVKGGPLLDKDGKEFHPSNPKAYDGPILDRKNNNRPIRREPGNG